MAYADLTQQEQQELSEWLDVFIRPLAGDYSRWIATAQVAKDRHDAGIDAILAQLVNNDTVPNTSTLGAVKSVTKGQLNSVLSFLNANLTRDNKSAVRKVLVAMAGVNAITD